MKDQVHRCNIIEIGKREKGQGAEFSDLRLSFVLDGFLGLQTA